MNKKTRYTTWGKAKLTKCQTKDKLKTLSNIILGVVIIAFITAPYLHMFVEKSSTEKVFGYKNIRYFVWIIGLPSSLLMCSLLLMKASSYIQEKNTKNFFTTISFLFIWSSLFQFIWIFWEIDDLPKSFYYASITILSCLTAIIFQKLILSKKETISKLRTIIDNLSRFSIISAKKYIEPEKEDAYNDELIETLKKGMK